MPHEILYDHIGPTDSFKTLRLIWEPLSEHVSLYFRTDREAIFGMVKPVAEMMEYFDRRALSGPPWNSSIAHHARSRLAAVAGDEAPVDPLEPEDEETRLPRTG